MESLENTGKLLPFVAPTMLLDVIEYVADENNLIRKLRKFVELFPLKSI